MKLNAKQLRVTKPSGEQIANIGRKPIYIVLDSVMDTYNIGSIFRLADAVAAKELILCGRTEAPPSSRIHKAAVGTEEWVPWRYFADAKPALLQLKQEVPEIKIIAVEQDERAISLFNITLSDPPLNLRGGRKGELLPMAVVVGHETEGVSQGALDLADVIVEIPMYGINKSLNVVVSTSIVLYTLVGVV